MGNLCRKIKRREKSNKNKKAASILDGIPSQMPALALAQRIQERAANVGFDWDNKNDVIKKVKEEWQEFNDACQCEDPDKIEDEFGDLLFALVNLARFVNVNAEQALRRTIDKFNQRFRYIEQQASKKKRDLQKMTLKEMDAFWNEAKDKQG